MAKQRKLTNPLALALLTTLQERPMHPYEMASVLRSRGKEQSVKINYGSLYTVVQNLQKHGFIEVAEVQRQGRRPERTLYGLTDAGHAEAHDWLAELVREPEKEYPSFEAALALILALPPDEVIHLLEERIGRIEAELAGMRAMIDQQVAQMPRIFLVEGEFAISQREAEVRWIREFVAGLKNGDYQGLAEWRSWHETGTVPKGWAEEEEALRRAQRAGAFPEAGDPEDGDGAR